MKRSVSILCVILSVFSMGLAHGVETSTAGDLVGQFQVNSGSARYGIPLAVPVGTTGVQPDLMLNYTSSGGSGIIGSGWSLSGSSFSSISECPKTIAQDGISGGAFGSGKYCLDGMRLVAVNGSYGSHGAEYRTEVDSGVKVVSYVVDSKLSFRVWTKAGLLKEYGRIDNSRITDSLGNMLSWSVDRITDTMGNYMVYEYYQPADKSYSILSKISYTGNYNTGLSPYAYVQFVFEDRPDGQFDVYRDGAKFRQTKRLKEVVSYVKNNDGVEELYRKYKITYKINDFIFPSKQSQVEYIEECTAGDVCSTPTNFNMTQGVRANFIAGEVKNGIVSSIGSSCTEGGPLDVSRLMHVDVNGDGKTDIYEVNGSGTSAIDTVHLSNGDGTYTEVASGVNSFVDSDVQKAGLDISRIQFGDFDGDSNVDIYYIKGYNSAENDLIYFGNGDGTFNSASTTNFASYIDASGLDFSRFRFVDLNGDGRTDIYFISGRDSVSQDVVKLSEGGVNFTDQNSGVMTSVAGSADRALFDMGRVKLVDINADGLSDVFYSRGWGANATPYVQFNNGDGTFSAAVDIGIPFYIGNTVESAGFDDSRIKFGDFNGDSVVDIYYVNGWNGSSEDDIYFGKGNGKFTAKKGSGIITHVSGNYPDARVDNGRIRILDINGDGLSDVYYILGWGGAPIDRIYQGKGDGTFYFNDSEISGVATNIHNSADCAAFDMSKISFIDHDGDGYMDIYQINDSGTDSITINPAHESVLSKIINGSGVEVDIEYKKLTDSSVYERQLDLCWKGGRYVCLWKMQLGWTPPPPKSKYPNTKITPVMTVVSRVGSSDGIGGKNYINYKYHDLKVNKLGRGMLGFGKIEVFDETTQGKVVTEYNQTWPFAGMETYSRTYVYKDGAHVKIGYTYNSVGIGSAEGELPIRVEPYASTYYSYTVDGELASSTTTEYTHDEYGNVLQVKQRSVVEGNEKETITDNVYDNFPSKWHMGRLRRATVTHKLTGYADKVNTTEFTYDRGTGLIEREIVEPDNPQLYAKTEYIRDAYGNVTSTKTTSNNVTYDADGNAQYASSGQEASLENAGYTSVYMTRDPASQWYADHPAPSLYIPIMMDGITIFIENPNYVEPEPGPGTVSTYGSDPASYEYPESWSQYQQDIAEVTSGYDSRGRFPTWSENQLGHRETYVYDQVKAVKTSQTGPNGNTVSWVYDDFTRLVQVNSPDGTWGKTSYHMHSDTYPFMVKTINSKGSETVVYQDILRRAVISQGKDFQGNWKVSKKVFNKRGQLEREYPAFTPSVQQSDYTSYNFDLEDRYVDVEYDVISRPLKSKLWHGVRGEYITTETIYEKGKTTGINALGQKSVSYTDILTGNLTSVEEHKGAEVYTTQYRYDISGKLLETEDELGNITSIYYDELGRKVAMDDKDLGHWEYRYNSFGKLVWQKDAKGQIVTFNYDELGRTVQRSEPEAITTWVYDIRTNGIGKLAYITKSNNGYREDVYYDSLGRVQTTTTVIDGESYSTTSTYDAQGRPDTFTYPAVTGLNDVVVKNHYQLGSKAYKQTDATTGASYWELNEADEEHSKVTYGNGLQTIKTFDKYTLFLKGIDTGFYSEVQSLRYDYDDIGNVLSRKDQNQNLEEIFGYDSLNRLTSYSVNGNINRTVEYDALGNITYKSDVGTYQYNSSRTHAVTNTASQVHSYDANGNLYDTRTGSTVDRSVNWTSFNKPASMTKDGVTAIYTYGAGHNRVTKDKGNKKTIYVGSIYEKEIEGSTVKHTYYVGSAVIKKTMINGSLSNESKNYMHKDNQGSTDVITDENGDVVERQSYDAWGERRQSNNWSDALTSITSDITTKGYTGHEMDDEFDLVNMKGRIYDPVLGRFMSADPFVQSPGNPQSFNRYAYVYNNPLKYTDPSGYFSWKGALTGGLSGGSSGGASAVGVILGSPSSIGTAIGTAIAYESRHFSEGTVTLGWNSGIYSIGVGAKGAVMEAFLPGAGQHYVQHRIVHNIAFSPEVVNLFLKNKYAAQAGGVIAGMINPWAAAGFAAYNVRINGGGKNDQFKAFAISMIASWATKGVGDIGGDVQAATGSLAAATATKMVLHGVIGGIVSAANGGKFADGFTAAAFTTMYGGLVKGGVIGMPSSSVAQVAIAAVVGGTASKLGGGKFSNGAVTGAFMWMYNELKHKQPSGARRSARRRARAQRGSTTMPKLAEGRYLAVTDEISFEIGLDVEMGDLWIIDTENDRHLHFGFVGGGGGISVGASFQRHIGAIYVSSTSNVEGFAFQIEADGLAGFGGGGSFDLVNQAFDPPSFFGGLGVGVEAGITGVVGYTWFKKVYDANDSPLVLAP